MLNFQESSGNREFKNYNFPRILGKDSKKHMLQLYICAHACAYIKTSFYFHVTCNISNYSTLDEECNDRGPPYSFGIFHEAL